MHDKFAFITSCKIFTLSEEAFITICKIVLKDHWLISLIREYSSVINNSHSFGALKIYKGKKP